MAASRSFDGQLVEAAAQFPVWEKHTIIALFFEEVVDICLAGVFKEVKTVVKQLLSVFSKNLIRIRYNLVREGGDEDEPLR